MEASGKFIVSGLVHNDVAAFTSTDVAGNASTGSVTISDMTAPALALDAPVESGGKYSVSGTTEVGAKVSVSVNGGVATAVTMEASGKFTVSGLVHNDVAAFTSTDVAGNATTTSVTI